MNGPLAIVISIVSSTLAGRSLLALFDRVLGGSDPARPRSEVCGLSILLGMGFTSAAAFVWSDMGRPLNAGFSWGQVALGTVLGLIAIFKDWRRRRSQPVPLLQPFDYPLARVCQVLIGLAIAAGLVQCLLTPQRFWDERAIFAIKARVLYETQSIDAPELRHADFVQGHPRYPMMLPLLERHVYGLLGQVDDRWAKVWGPLMYAGLVLSFAGILSRRYSPDWGWLIALALALVPALLPEEYGFLSAQADAPMACFHGVAVLCLWDALQAPAGASRRRGVILASSIASIAFFIKDEGTAFLIIDLLAWGLALIVGGGRLVDVPNESRLQSLSRHLAAMAAFGIFAAILLTPWMRHRATLPTTTEMHYFERMEVGRLGNQLSTLTWSVPHLLQRMFAEWRIWGVQWWLLAIAALTVPRRALAGPQQFLAWNLLGSLAAFVVAGMLAPAELEEHLGGSSHRYLMQLAPVAILFVGAVWGKCPTRNVP